MNEQEFADARERMVQEQLIPHQVVDPRVLEAMRRVPRHLFVPADLAEQAYENYPLPIGLDQTISQPLMVAMMAQMLRLTGAERVLDVGTGSGYQAAVLAELAAEVISIERHAPLADQAQTALAQCRCANVTVVIGDGTLGFKERAPYERILVGAAANAIPQSLIDQLTPNGRLVMPVGPPELQTLTVITTDERGHAFTHEHGGCVFVPLIHGKGA
jgi:protein-L-isoaspartate(D-aspartate) O-methyltransferase